MRVEGREAPFHQHPLDILTPGKDGKSELLEGEDILIGFLEEAQRRSGLVMVGGP